MTDETYTVDEAARLLRISRDSVVRAIQRGDLPGRKVGKFWRIPRAGFADWLQGRR